MEANVDFCLEYNFVGINTFIMLNIDFVDIQKIPKKSS